ncbi:MAG: hypothetical protein AAF684_03785, partial [Pseudomonadota bacterium]
GDAALTSGDALSLTRASIGGALQATADLDGSAGDAAATLRNVGVGALAIDAGEAVDLDAVSVTRNASLRARRGDIRLGSVLVEGDAIFVAEQGSIRTQAGRAERDDFAVNLTFAPEAPQGLSSTSPGAGSGVVTRSRVAARAFETLLAVEGDAWFDASGDVLLPGDGTLQNDFGGRVTVSRAARVALSDRDDLVLGAPSREAPGGAALPHAGLYNRVNGEEIESLRIEAGGTLTDTSGARVRVDGDVWLQAGGDVLLDSGLHDIGGSVGAQARDVALSMLGGVTLGPIRASGDLQVQTASRGDADASFIRQTSSVTAPELVMFDGLAGGGDATERGAIEVMGGTDLSTGAPAGRPLTDRNGRGEVALTQRRNQFTGPVSLRRIFGDVVIVDEADAALAGQDDADGGVLAFRNIDAGGDVAIRTSDDVVLIGRLTALNDDDPARRPAIPTSETAAERRAQGRAGLADDALRLYIADGKRLLIDTTAGGADPSGGDIRFDRPVDGANDLIARRTAESAASRGEAGGVVLNAGREGHVRLRDYLGVGHPIGLFRILDAQDVSLGHTFKDRDATRQSPDRRFLLGRGDQERDVVNASVINIDARGRVELFVSPETFALYDENDDFFGVNTSGLKFGEIREPRELTLFGFIGNSGERAAGIFAEGPDVKDTSRFQFNGCTAGDVLDCARVTQPSVLEIVRIDQAQILNVDEEDLLELFVSYGNEELWGVPPGYFLDVDVSAARSSGNAQAGRPAAPNFVTT